MTTHPHVAPKFIMCGVLPPIHLHDVVFTHRGNITATNVRALSLSHTNKYIIFCNSAVTGLTCMQVLKLVLIPLGLNCGILI
jgi:hypothetical protein